MAMGIIDQLQLINVEEQEPVTSAITMGAPAPAIQFIHEIAAIEKRGQRVRGCQPFKLGYPSPQPPVFGFKIMCRYAGHSVYKPIF